MAVGYTKLFSEIIMSTVWREPDHVRLLWITMLALKDRWHIVNASIPGLADSARITQEQCLEAIRILSAPDMYSRSEEYEGRRIEKCDGGFLILNGEKYRNKMSLDERREYQRIKQKEYRERNKDVKSCQQNSQQLTHTDTDTDTDTESYINNIDRVADKPPKSNRFIKPSLIEIREYCQSINAAINPVTFYNHYEANGWKVGKNTMKDWKAAIRGWNSRESGGKQNGKLSKLDQAAASINKYRPV